MIGTGERLLVLSCEEDEKIRPIENICRNDEAGLSLLSFNHTNNHLYVMGGYPDTVPMRGHDTLFIIDCATRQIVRKIGFNVSAPYTAPAFIAVNRLNNKIYLGFFSSRSESKLFVIDGWTHEIIKTISVNPMLHGWGNPRCIWNPRTNKLYFIGADSIFENLKIYTLDGVTDSITNSIDIYPKEIMSLEIIPSDQWDKLFFLVRLVDWEISQILLVFDCERNQVVQEIEVERSEKPIFWGYLAYNQFNNRVYVGFTTYWTFVGKVKVVDLNQGVVIDSLIFPDAILGWIRFNPHNRILYCFFGLSAVMIDGETNRIVGEIDLEGVYYAPKPVFYHPMRNKLYYINDITVIGVIDCWTNQVVKQILPGIDRPYDLLLNPLTNKLYASISITPRIMIFDASQNRATAILNLREYIGTSAGVGYGAVCTQLNKIYFSCGGGTIVALDGRTDSVLTIITQIPQAVRLYYLEGVNKIYTSPAGILPQNPFVYVIDCSTDEVIDSIRCGFPISGFGYSSRTNKVYISTSAEFWVGTRLRVIDATRDIVIKEIVGIDGNIEYDRRKERFYIGGGWMQSSLFNAVHVPFSSTFGDSMLIFTPPPRALIVLTGERDSVTNCIREATGLIVFDSIDNWIYGVVNSPSPCMKVIDLETNQWFDTIPIGLTTGVFWNPINNKVYTGRFDLEVIDCRTNQRIARFSEDWVRMDIIEWNPFQNRLYVATEKSKLLVIRDEIPGIEEVRNSKMFKRLEISPTLGTSFRLSWRGKEEVKVGIYNALGRKAREFKIKPGGHFTWDGRDERNNKLSSGVYFLKALGREEIKLILRW